MKNILKERKTLIESLTSEEKTEVKELFSKELSKMEKRIAEIVLKQLKEPKSDEVIREIVADSLYKLYKNLYEKRSFWTSYIKKK